MASHDLMPKILCFMCQWCGYSAADLAGASRLGYPASVRSIEVTCSGMVHPNWVINALLGGIDGVMIFGCHLGQCHYGSGNQKALERKEMILETLEDLGIEEERFSLKWVSAAEARQLVEEIKGMTEKIRHLGPNRACASRVFLEQPPLYNPEDTEFVRIVSDKRYYWDGNLYKGHASAQKAIADYLDRGFEAKLVPTDKGILIYTRRDGLTDEDR